MDAKKLAKLTKKLSEVDEKIRKTTKEIERLKKDLEPFRILRSQLRLQIEKMIPGLSDVVTDEEEDY